MGLVLDQALEIEKALSLKILVVDDDALGRQLMHLILTREGHRVDVAANGLEALAASRWIALLSAAGVDETAGVDDVVLGLHGALAASPAALVVATLEDALRVERRPNMPGTVATQRPNWSIPLPVPVEDLGGDARVRSLLRVLGRGR